MTEARRQELEEKLNVAEAHGDEAEIAAIRKTMNQEYRLCTSHTAERIKRVEATVNAIKEGLIPDSMFNDLKKGLTDLSSTVNEVKTELGTWKSKAQGAQLLWKVLGYVTAAGGSGAILKLLLSNDKIQ